MTSLDVLIPTVDRLASFIMTFSALANQDFQDLRVIVADQNEESIDNNNVVRSLIRIFESKGIHVSWHHRFPSQGIAEQRHFLLQEATADQVLFLDDDVFMEPWVIGKLTSILARESCGFVGAFPSGLSFRDDVRPHQQLIEYWDGPVIPESLTPQDAAWQRAQLHRAANLWHLANAMSDQETRLYKVAWVASCVLYNRSKLLEVGGFKFWSKLSRYHSGEDVLVQNLLMRRWGGCAIIPSGTYHSEEPSTVLNQDGRVDSHALQLLDEMIGDGHEQS